MPREQILCPIHYESKSGGFGPPVLCFMVSQALGCGHVLYLECVLTVAGPLQELEAKSGLSFVPYTECNSDLI